MSTKLNFVAVGVFYAELNELLACELAEDGYASVKVHITPHHIEVIILATCKHFFGRKGTMHPWVDQCRLKVFCFFVRSCGIVRQTCSKPWTLCPGSNLPRDVKSLFLVSWEDNVPMLWTFSVINAMLPAWYNKRAKCPISKPSFTLYLVHNIICIFIVIVHLLRMSNQCIIKNYFPQFYGGSVQVFNYNKDKMKILFCKAIIILYFKTLVIITLNDWIEVLHSMQYFMVFFMCFILFRDQYFNLLYKCTEQCSILKY